MPCSKDEASESLWAAKNSFPNENMIKAMKTFLINSPLFRSRLRVHGGVLRTPRRPMLVRI